MIMKDQESLNHPEDIGMSYLEEDEIKCVETLKNEVEELREELLKKHHITEGQFKLINKLIETEIQLEKFCNI